MHIPFIYIKLFNYYSTKSPFLTPAAFPSSKSTCISNAKAALALTNTLLNNTALSPVV